MSLMQQQHTHHINLLIAQKNPDLEQIIGLVDRLCQRVQAPSQAVIDHSMQQHVESAPPPIAMDDDAGWAATRLSAEELAQREFEAEREALSAA